MANNEKPELFNNESYIIVRVIHSDFISMRAPEAIPTFNSAGLVITHRPIQPGSNKK